METIIIRVTRVPGSKRVYVRTTWFPHGERLGRRGTAEMHAENPDAELDDGAMWELTAAVRNEIEGWQARLPLQY